MINVVNDKSEQKNDFDEGLGAKFVLETEKLRISKLAKSPKPCFIVGIGVSDGGLDDLATFLKKLPIETGMSFVVISNLHIDRETSLIGILQSVTSMRVREIDGQIVAEPNCVYVSTPDTIVTINQRILIPFAVDQSDVMGFPVDIFFNL